MPGITLTSDVIVGFPGETYAEFCQTLSLIKEVRFNSLFTFIFSPRPGTPAWNMPDNVSRAEKGKWFNELLLTQEPIGKELEQEMLGKAYKVLCEELGKDGQIIAKTDGNIAVEFNGPESLIGSFVNIKITGINGGLKATLI